MPKNKGKGGKNRRRGKNENDGAKRELIFKEDGQEYGFVQKLLGNGRAEVVCYDGVKRLGLIRGKMRKKVWINGGDTILVSLRDYQDVKADIILKYTSDEARSLKAYGELPANAIIAEGNDPNAEDQGDQNALIGVEFEDDRSEGEEDSAPEESDEDDEDEEDEDGVKAVKPVKPVKKVVTMKAPKPVPSKSTVKPQNTRDLPPQDSDDEEEVMGKRAPIDIDNI